MEPTTAVYLVWGLIGALLLAKFVSWVMRRPAMPQEVPQLPRTGPLTALDQRREYLDTCGRSGTCAVMGCGATATEKFPLIVQEHSVRDGLIRWIGHKPQDRYRVALDVGTHNLLCGGHATIAVSLAELELAQRNAAYAEHCRDQAQRIVEFQLVDLLDTLSAGMQAATKRVQQRPTAAAKLAVVPSSGTEG